MITDHFKYYFPENNNSRYSLLLLSLGRFRLEQDREKYIRIIEMSNVIQTKLQTLEFDRKRNQAFSKIQPHHRNDILTNRNLSLDIKRSGGNKPIFFLSSSSSYANSYSDDNDLPIGADGRYVKETYTSKYHTYSEGSFKHLEKVHCSQLQSVIPLPTLPPPSTNAIGRRHVDKEEEKSKKTLDYFQNNINREDEEKTICSETMVEKISDNSNVPLKNTKKLYIPAITISLDDTYDIESSDDDDDENNDSGETYDSNLDYSSDEDDEDDDDDDQVIQYNHLNPPQIHIAVRRDASLFKIEKISRENMTPAFNLAEVPKISNLTQKAEIDNDQNWVLSVPKQKNQVLTATSTGMFTPPESPECQYNTNQDDDNKKFGKDNAENVNHEQLVNDICFARVQKKAHRSLKSFITGTYQLNHLTVTKVNASISPYSCLHSAVDNTTRKNKLLLKIIIVSLTEEASEQQRRFGFTFWWHKSVSCKNQEQRFRLQDDAKFAIAPDSLVKESLVTWIDSQNKAQGEGIQLPCLSKADSIMRDGKKIYVVYDPSLFLV